jgi:small subunit ribosomal protein S5
MEDKIFEEKVIEISRVSRTVKGGKRISFRALVIIGDKSSRAGIGLGKAGDVSVAIKKAVAGAKRNLMSVSLNDNGSIKRETVSVFNSAKVLLRPAPEGTSIISGGVVRAVAELAGVKNLVAKSYGSSNKINLAKATLGGLIKASSNE